MKKSVFVLKKFIENDAYTNRYGGTAPDSMEILGVYDSYSLVDEEKIRLAEEALKERENNEDAESCYFRVEEYPVVQEKEVLLKRYEAVMTKIPLEVLLDLPDAVKTALKTATDLRDKVRLLEDIASNRKK